MENSKDTYRFVITNFNNLLKDKEGFDIYKKYLYKGLDKLRSENGNEDFCNTIDRLVMILSHKQKPETDNKGYQQ